MTIAAGLSARFGKLSKRERVILIMAALSVVIGIGYVLFIEPTLKREALLERQIVSQRAEVDAVREAINATAKDPNGQLREQLAALRTQLRETDRQFDTLQNGLVQPQHMGALLQSLLSEHRGLRLLGLRTLPVRAASDIVVDPKKVAVAPTAPNPPASTTESEDDAWLFRHSVEIRVQGSYADMVSYLQDIEHLPRRVHWGGLDIDAKLYPASVMTVTIYTVSLERSWWVL